MAITVFAGCNKEDIPSIKTTTLTCGFAEEQPATKVAFDKTDLADTVAKIQPKWEAGDAIAAVLDDGSLVKFTLKTGAGTKKATFEGTVPDGRTVESALYPWIDGDDITSANAWINGFLMKLIYGHQTYDADRIFDSNFNAYYGAVSGDNVSFTQLNDEIQLQGMAPNIGYILFRLKGTAKISGIQLNISDGGISLYCSNPVQLDSDSETLFGMVIPMLYVNYVLNGKLTFGFYDENNNTILTKTINVGTVEAHTLLDLPVLTVDAPPATTGTAAVTVEGAGITSCDWVQLWADGPKFATMNLGETTVTGNTKTYTWTESGSDNDAATVNWGSNWKVPTKEEMNELFLATSSKEADRSSSKITCEYTTYENTGVYGFLFKGEGDFAENSLFLPADGDAGSYGGEYAYWSGTLAGSGGTEDPWGYYFRPASYGGSWYSNWSSNNTKYVVRPVLK